MVAWKKIPVFTLAGFLLIVAGVDISGAQGTGVQVNDAKATDAQADTQVVDFTFREISLGDTFEAAREKAKKLGFKFFYIKEAIPGISDFIRTRDCSSNEACDNLLIYFNFTESTGHVSRIVYTHFVKNLLNVEDITSLLEESYGPPALKVDGNSGPDEKYIQWGGENKPDTFNGADLEKTPELVGGKYILATILKNRRGNINLTMEITDSREFIDGKDEINRLVKLNAQQEKEAAIKKIKFR